LGRDSLCFSHNHNNVLHHIFNNNTMSTTSEQSNKERTETPHADNQETTDSKSSDREFRVNPEEEDEHQSRATLTTENPSYETTLTNPSQEPQQDIDAKKETEDNPEDESNSIVGKANEYDDELDDDEDWDFETEEELVQFIKEEVDRQMAPVIAENRTELERIAKRVEEVKKFDDYMDRRFEQLTEDMDRNDEHLDECERHVDVAQRRLVELFKGRHSGVKRDPLPDYWEEERYFKRARRLGTYQNKYY